MIALDIFADPVCPWCVIGKARLERALAARPDHPFALAWQPFQLNPTMARAGMSRADYLQAKFGQDGAVKMLAQVIEIAKAEQIEIDPLSVRHQPNTLDALRLVHWAGLEGAGSAVMDALMRAHWVQSRDIGAPTTLCEIAREAGLDGAMISRLLASDADRDTILERDRHARARGVRAVPTFILDNRHVIEGAEPSETWLAVIAELEGDPSGPRH